MNRTQKDALLIKSKALPAAAAAAYTDSVELGLNGIENIQAQIIASAVSALVDAKVITYTFQDSADGITFANIAELASLVQTGASGAGAAAATRTVYFPPSVRKYVRGAAAVESGGGDNTAVSFTFQILA